MPDLEAEYGSLADAIRRLEAPMGPMGRLARSKKGALGPYQFMPATARQYGLDDPTDETQAREAALQYLHDAAVSLNTQDPRLLLAAYNAGPGAVRKYGDVPPYGETQSYVRRGLEYLIPAAEAAETFEVELPDGRVVEGIPVGTTKAEFVAKARANGVEIPESWLQGSEPGGEAAQAAQPMVGAESPVSEALTEMIAPARRVPSAIAEEFARGGEMAGAGMQALTQPTSPLGAVKGLGQAALGGLQQFFSPITGGVRALAGEPIEAATGIPSQATETAAGLAVPVAGMSRAGQAALKAAGPLGQAVAAYAGASVPRPGYALAPLAEAPADAMAMAEAAAGPAWAEMPKQTRAALADLMGRSERAQLLVREAQARGMPEPATLTRGQMTRDPVQLRFETQTGALPAGAPLRTAAVEMNRALSESLDKLFKRTKARETEMTEVGRAVVDRRLVKLRDDSIAVYEAGYKAAEKAGEMQEPIDVTPLINYLKSTPEPLLTGYVRSGLRALGALGRDESGVLSAAKPITLLELEGIRKAATAAAKDGGSKAHYASEVKGVIDTMTEGKGGELYQAANAAFREHKQTYDDPEIIRNILGRVKGGDRRTELEDVWSRTVIGGSPEQLKYAKKVIIGHNKSAGIAAWREMQGATIAYLRSKALLGTLDESGRETFTASGFERALESIGKQKLDLILGEETRRDLYNILAVAKLAKTLPPARIGGSDTAVNLAMRLGSLLERIPLIGGLTRHLAGGAWRAGKELIEQSRTARRVESALNPLPRPAAPRIPFAQRAREQLRAQIYPAARLAPPTTEED